MKKIFSLLFVLGFLGITTAKFAYDPVSNTFSYTNDTPAVVATGNIATGTTSTGVVMTSTGVTNLSNTDIAGLLKLLDTNTLSTLSTFKSSYDTEYARLTTVVNDATAKGYLGLVLCFSSNQKSPDQLKQDLKNLYETSTKSLVEKSSLLAGQLTTLDKQLQYGSITTENLGLALVGPRADITTLGDMTKNGSKEFATVLSSVTTQFQQAVAKVASGSLVGGNTTVLERYTQFTKLETDFSDFSNKISLQGVGISTLPQLDQAKQSFLRLAGLQYATATNKAVMAFVPVNLSKNADIVLAIDKAQRNYDESLAKYATTLLQDLTQIKGVTDIANAVALVRAIYKPQTDVLCNAFSENRYIGEVGPKISNQMQEVLKALNTAANRVALEKGVLVKDVTQLQQGYLKAITSFAESTRTNSIRNLKAKVTDIVNTNKGSMLKKARSVPLTVADQVAGFLGKKMEEFVSQGRLGEFNAMITQATERLATFKSTTKNKKLLQTLNEIEEGMKLFQ